MVNLLPAVERLSGRTRPHNNKRQVQTQLNFRDVSFDLLSGRNLDRAMVAAMAENQTSHVVS